MLSPFNQWGMGVSGVKHLISFDVAHGLDVAQLSKLSSIKFWMPSWQKQVLLWQLHCLRETRCCATVETSHLHFPTWCNAKALLALSRVMLWWAHFSNSWCKCTCTCAISVKPHAKVDRTIQRTPQRQGENKRWKDHHFLLLRRSKSASLKVLEVKQGEEAAQDISMLPFVAHVELHGTSRAVDIPKPGFQILAQCHPTLTNLLMCVRGNPLHK